MPMYKRRLIRMVVVFMIFIPAAGFAHYIIFPEETRSMLIDYSAFKKDGNVYFDAQTPQKKIDTLKVMVTQATLRVAGFWGQKIIPPKFIYCDKQTDFKKYSIAPTAPAVTYCKMGSYIVLSSEGLDQDIIAHEMSHAALFQQIGFFNRLRKIPAWFDEGLAMQNDYRDYYSEDTFRVRSNNFTNVPGIKNLNGAQFAQGSPEAVMLHYMAAKHIVQLWYSKEKLGRFIHDVNAGKSFDEAFGLP